MTAIAGPDGWPFPALHRDTAMGADMPMRRSRLVLSSAFLLSAASACFGASPAIGSAPVDADWLARQDIGVAGRLVQARRITDGAGEHVLVLARKAGASPSRPRSGRIERIDLAATLYGRTGAGWRQEWHVRDGVDCPDLDADAAFFTDAVAVTDVNGDGRAEVTIPYRLFCGGGVEPSTVKVILREGALKLAIRGESLVRLPGQQPFGGARQDDAVLREPRMAVYKRHLDGVWRAVVAQRWR